MATQAYSAHESALPSSVRACVCVPELMPLILYIFLSLTLTSYLRCSFSATILDYLDRVSVTSEIIICTLLVFRYTHTTNSSIWYVCWCYIYFLCRIFSLFMCLMNNNAVPSVNSKCLINKKYTHIRLFGA